MIMLALLSAARTRRRGGSTRRVGGGYLTYLQQREEPVTYATATPEQIARAREDARRKLREARERMTPERWQELRDFITAQRA